MFFSPSFSLPHVRFLLLPLPGTRARGTAVHNVSLVSNVPHLLVHPTFSYFILGRQSILETAT